MTINKLEKITVLRDKSLVEMEDLTRRDVSALILS